MTAHQARLIALAHIRLSEDTPATEAVLHALSLLEAVLPASGTANHREAFKWAHETREIGRNVDAVQG